MTATDVERLLQSIGKRCFRNCYDIAIRRGGAFDVRNLVAGDPALEGTSPRAQATRVSKIKRLVREGRAKEALALCEGARKTN